jgi:hypothetical protein
MSVAHSPSDGHSVHQYCCSKTHPRRNTLDSVTAGCHYNPLLPNMAATDETGQMSVGPNFHSPVSGVTSVIPAAVVSVLKQETTASVVYWSEFLATDPEVPGSLPGATRFSE